MPGLVVFNRKWSLGSDDLVFVGIIEICIRLIWLIILSVVYHILSISEKCLPDGDHVQVYMIGELVFLTVTICITVVMVVISSRGSITNVRPRHFIPLLIYIRCVLGVAEISWTIIGSIWTFKSWSCPDEKNLSLAVLISRAAVICTWIFFVVFLISITFVFDSLGKHKLLLSTGSASDIDELWKQSRLASRKIWENRFKFLCCCIGKDDHSQAAFREVADLISSFFMDVDLVPSDLAAGMILLQQEQEQIRFKQKSDSSSKEHSQSEAISYPILSPSLSQVSEPCSWMAVGSAAHFLKFAMGSYGWLLYIWTNSPRGFCKIWPYIRCFVCCQRVPLIAINDNCCGCNTAALKQVTGLNDNDLIYVSFHNRIFEVPFFVALDHKTKSVIVSIRASLSLSDAITDMLADSESISMPFENQEKLSAHRGILHAAAYIKNKLLEEGLLDKAFKNHENYILLLTGHSLGAGTAAILAVMLKQYYPNLRCFAFSPPGGLMNADASIYSRNFICSVVLGDDLVARMSLQSLDLLKNSLIRVIGKCQIPKYQILMSGLFRAFFKKMEPMPNLDSSASTDVKVPLLKDSVPISARKSLMEVAKRLSTSSQDAMSSDAGLVFGHSRFTYTPLYLPGQILHLQPLPKHHKNQYQEVWSHPNNFQQILVSPTMIADHFPDAVMKALQEIMNSDNENLIQVSIDQVSISTDI